jgi:hypothetical protein
VTDADVAEALAGDLGMADVAGESATALGQSLAELRLDGLALEPVRRIESGSFTAKLQG